MWLNICYCTKNKGSQKLFPQAKTLFSRPLSWPFSSLSRTFSLHFSFETNKSSWYGFLTTKSNHRKSHYIFQSNDHFLREKNSTFLSLKKNLKQIHLQLRFTPRLAGVIIDETCSTAAAERLILLVLFFVLLFVLLFVVIIGQSQRSTPETGPHAANPAAGPILGRPPSVTADVKLVLFLRSVDEPPEPPPPPAAAKPNSEQPPEPAPAHQPG